MNENEKKDGVLHCDSCGAVYTEDYEFCPECGAKLVKPPTADDAGTVDADPDETPTPDEASASPADEKKKGGLSKKVWAVIGAIALAAIIVIVVLANIMTERPLVLNSGEEIDIYVGDKKDITIEGEGLEKNDYQMTLWSTDNEKVLKVNNGEIEAFYDSSSFNAIDEDAGSDEATDVCSCTTYVRASIEKGIRKWGGSAKVNISIEPVELKDGKIIKKPADSQDSYLEVTSMDDYDTYIYLKSKTKESNDMSFTIKRGSTTRVDVPMDEYEMYWAVGTTWYGSEFLFGPGTEYQKSAEDWDFREYSWSFKMNVQDGNVGSEYLDEDEFPEL